MSIRSGSGGVAERGTKASFHKSRQRWASGLVRPTFDRSIRRTWRNLQ